MPDEKKIERITPTELGVWMVCRKKWLFDYRKRQARYKSEKGGRPSPEKSGNAVGHNSGGGAR